MPAADRKARTTAFVLTPLLFAAACSSEPGNTEQQVQTEQDIHEEIVRFANEMPELHKAVANGSEPEVRRLLAAGADPNQLAGEWLPALELAAGGEPCRVGIIDALVEHGADINQEGVLGSTPLLVAAESGNKDCFEDLVRRGANVRHVNANGHGIVVHAYWSGNAGLFAQVVGDDAMGPKSPRDLAAALIVAIVKEDRQACALLLEAGADPGLELPRSGTASARLSPKGIASLAECRGENDFGDEHRD